MRLQAKSTTGETYRGRDTQRFLTQIRRRLLREIKVHAWNAPCVSDHGAVLAYCTVRHILAHEGPCYYCSKWLDVTFHWVPRNDITFGVGSAG